jgi:hypothetical protein
MESPGWSWPDDLPTLEPKETEMKSILAFALQVAGHACIKP